VDVVVRQISRNIRARFSNEPGLTVARGFATDFGRNPVIP
jgi:hypothetical protein